MAGFKDAARGGHSYGVLGEDVKKPQIIFENFLKPFPKFELLRTFSQNPKCTKILQAKSLSFADSETLLSPALF